MTSFERPNIKKMSGYSFGEQPENLDVIKLNTNENPFPPSPAVAEVLRNFDAAALRRYPAATAPGFRRAAANLHGLAPENIIATRGGDELLRLVITTFADPGELITMTDPTYSLYPVLAEIQNCRVLKVPLAEDWQLPDTFAKTANQAGTKLTFVVNPHAPSGQLVSTEQIRQLATQLDSLLLVDEAYVDFIHPERHYQCLDLVERHKNIIFLRTLSKGYGLAGLRFGYGIGHPDLIQPMLEKTRDSYNLDAISQAVAVAAIGDQAYAKATWIKVREERERVHSALTRLGCKSPESEANFLLASVKNAERVYQGLKSEGILVRYFDTPGLDDKLRISIGTKVENEKLLQTLSGILQESVYSV